MKKFIFSFLLLSSIIYLSCEEENNPLNENNNENEIIFTPLIDGALWMYRGTPPSWIEERNEEIIAEENDGYYKVKVESYLYIASSGELYAWGIDTVYKKYTNEGLLILDKNKENAEYELKKPYEMGNSWSNFHTDGTTSYVENFEIIDVNATVVQPVGTFTGCLKINRWLDDNISNKSERIYAPNVGMIKSGYLILQQYVIP